MPDVDQKIFYRSKETRAGKYRVDLGEQGLRFAKKKLNKKKIKGIFLKSIYFKIYFKINLLIWFGLTV